MKGRFLGNRVAAAASNNLNVPTLFLSEYGLSPLQLAPAERHSNDLPVSACEPASSPM